MLEHPHQAVATVMALLFSPYASQNIQIRAASVLIEAQPAFAQNGGSRVVRHYRVLSR
jgi:hypothetical protein